MADNYLERREAEIAAGKGRKVIRRSTPSLDTLLHRNRSYRGYDPSRKVSETELRDIVAAARLAASGMNRQALRFRLVTQPEKVLPYIRLGAALPEEALPKAGQEPGAFIVICGTVAEDRILDIDLGFAAQSMLLRATEMGLGGLFILNFQREAIRESLSLPLEPLAVLAIGKPAERIFLLPAERQENPDLHYYRKDGIHYVPKLSLEQVLI